MKKFVILLFVLRLIITMPSHSNPAINKHNNRNIRNRFEKVDKNSDGLLSKSEMIKAHRTHIDKLFIKFDKDGDNKLSKKELSAIRKEIKKKINKSELKKD